jgi:Na+-translocating ferredoxin:NAD+ oxidoreductase subunit A
MRHHLVILLSAALVNNFTLVMFLGLCSFFGVTKKVATAVRLGIADTFVLIITSISATVLNKWVLRDAPYLRVIAFIVVIASMVQITEMTIKKFSPTLFRELGIYLPLITTNCAILALALFQTNRGYGFLEGLTFSIGAGLGLTAGAAGAGRRPRGGARRGHRAHHRQRPVDGVHGIRRHALHLVRPRCAY